ncbi:MAG TPA: hypothetical protein ENJ80_09865 [Gammaproteobacteria bacterium]|nr:hypothetical protein [Gammaproteobacteria bacterium]
MKPCWAHYLLWLVIALAGTGAILSGCGQEGGLYLPEQPAQPDPPAPQEQPAVQNPPAAQDEPDKN